MSDGVSNQTEPAAEDLAWFQIPGWRSAFFNSLIWLMPLLLVFGVLLNILCFITILRNPQTFPKISRRNMLIITAWDVATLAVIGTFFYHYYWNNTTGNLGTRALVEHRDNSGAACYFLQYLYKYLLNGTPYFHVALTVERVLAVVAPLKVKSIITPKSHCVMLLLLFLLGSTSSIVYAAMFTYANGRCQIAWNNPALFILNEIQYNFEFYVDKVALFIVLLSGCIIVAISLSVQSKAAAKMSINSDNSNRGKLVGSCSVMIFMNVLFFLTHAPRAALSVYESYMYQGSGETGALTEGELDMYSLSLYGLSLLHNIVNPLVYFIGQGFRTAFKNNFVPKSAIRRSNTQRPTQATTGV